MSILQELNLGLEAHITDDNKNVIETLSPATGKLLAKVKNQSLDDMQYAITNAAEVAKQWCQIPAPKRGELVRLIGEELRKNKDHLGSLVSLEMGKSKQEGDGEVQEMIDMADFVVGQSRMLYGVMMNSERHDHRMYEQWHPLGVVGVISAFNFPVAVWSWNAFIAVICGNTVVWKPSEKTPLCSIAVHNICQKVIQEHGYPEIFYTIISKEIEVSKALVNDERVNLVSFTGSTKVGQDVGQQVAKRFGKSILELGGNNATIIDESANLKLAIPAAVFGAVGTAGQRCTSLRRLFVHESIYDLVKDKMVNAYKQVTVGDPLDQKNLMGPLIDQASVDNFLKTVDQATIEGGKILTGGKKIAKAGFFVEPTIIEANANMPIVAEENFCPILYIMPFKDIDEAIKFNNSVRYGLSSSIFTDNIQNAEKFLSSLGSDCGIANVNIGTSGAEIGGAFGGEKHTGGGREAGSDAWKAYMRRQTSTINYGKDLPLAQGIKFNLED
ncbi:aldehyde dehydrogenase family protein [Francisella noatunensis]|uniref:aldehyde dehydrogenase (NAD(+)) n=1 Tax=Francisella noatunensis TaxID=657445 RepID=A0A9Q2KQB1_9GAMM|nr:aldehyde dehydrogenase family protein [Francisella noatunensis]MBK2028710.1 aldehyde dehydrogenase family protein [Francisella noatunensis]MBK2033419.1 aldehyde dehydrogenase family protein [Francisella noatunensis]MBK2048169.1 aldehyde dehydrogenase family protein [Francisella noatunensis]MBK2049880.1 aldehyde dehydrogenase family protein [Francisella noatunensis]MBK2051264.1 aldehyde dehydrogenase family protein [Francisella noatunensis]